MDMGHPSGMCDSSKVSPQLSIMDPSMGTSIVALKLIIARCQLLRVLWPTGEARIYVSSFSCF